MIRQQIEDPQGVRDPAAAKVLRQLKTIVETITGRRTGQAEIKALGPDATLAGVINKLNEVITRLGA